MGREREEGEGRKEKGRERGEGERKVVIERHGEIGVRETQHLF